MQLRDVSVGSRDVLISHMSEVNLRARLGDPDKLTAGSQAVSAAISMVTSNAALVSKLPHDLTRPSDPQKHAAARELAVRTQAMLRVAASTLKDRSKALAESSQREANSVLSLSNDRVETEIRQFVAGAVKTAEGMAKVSALSRSDIKIASVIASSPHYLLNMSAELHQTMQFNMIEHWAPGAYADMEMVAELERVIPAYERLEREIGATWYNPVIASQADTRVNIDG